MGASASEPTTSHGLELALLGLLRSHPSHAYELHQELRRQEALGLVWRLKQGNLYALLTKLEAAGYVESTLEPHGTRPPRKVLRLTEAGRAAFQAWLEAPVEHGRDFRLEFLAKLYFASQAGGEAVAVLIRQQRAACRVWLADLERQAGTVPAERPFERLVLRFRATQLEGILSWLDTCEQTLIPST